MPEPNKGFPPTFRFPNQPNPTYRGPPIPRFTGKNPYSWFPKLGINQYGGAGGTYGPEPAAGFTTPAPMGQNGLPTDAQLLAPGLVYSRSHKKWFDVDTGLEVSPTYAVSILNQLSAKGGQARQGQTQQNTDWMQLESARINQKVMGPQSPQWAEEIRREEKAKSWDAIRSQILGSLTEPSDWITRWNLVNQRNPFARQPQTDYEHLQSNLNQAKNEAAYWNAIKESMPNSEYVGNTAVGVGLKTTVPVTKYDERNDIEYTVQQEVTGARALAELAAKDATNWAAQAQAELDNYGNFDYGASSPEDIAAEQRRKQPPPAPYWLPKFAPGQTEGRPISKENIPTPSGQQWLSTPWSERQGLAGYTEWAGFRPFRDILESMAMAQPNTPSAGRGWRPAQQRI